MIHKLECGHLVESLPDDPERRDTDGYPFVTCPWCGEERAVLATAYALERR